MRWSSDGYVLMAPAANHYKAVKEVLNQNIWKFYTHDIEAEKPFKVVLRGLHEMDTAELAEELKSKDLKVMVIHKMRRHDSTKQYRDQLYLIHLEKGSTTLKELQDIRHLFHTIVE